MASGFNNAESYDRWIHFSESQRDLDLILHTWHKKAIKKLLGCGEDSYEKEFLRYLEIAYPDTESWRKLKTEQEMKHNFFHRTAFIYRRALVFTSNIAYNFLKLLILHPDVQQQLVRPRKVIKICSIGGGSASDVVALVSTLEHFARKEDISLDFRVTVLESNPEWKYTWYLVLMCLDAFSGCSWKLNYLEVDLQNQSLCKPALEALSSADIVSAINIFTNRQNHERTWQSYFKNIRKSLKENGLFYIMGTAPIFYRKSLGDISGKFQDMHLVYEEIHDIHFLHLSVEEQCSHSFRTNDMDYPMQKDFFFCLRIWIKGSDSGSKAIQFIDESQFRSFAGFSTFQEWEDGFIRKTESLNWNSKEIISWLHEITRRREELLSEMMHLKNKWDKLKKLLDMQIGAASEETVNSSLRVKENLCDLKKELHSFSMSTFSKMKKLSCDLE